MSLFADIVVMNDQKIQNNPTEDPIDLTQKARDSDNVSDSAPAFLEKVRNLADEYIRNQEKNLPDYESGIEIPEELNDAFRHAFASAYARLEHGEVPAAIWGDLHERVNFGSADAYEMDSHNNEVGRKIGAALIKQLGKDNVTIQNIQQAVMKSIEAGELIIKEGGSPVPYDIEGGLSKEREAINGSEELDLDAIFDKRKWDSSGSTPTEPSERD